MATNLSSREKLILASMARLSAVRNHHLTAADVKGNIENMIGAVQVPVGVAGPLKVEGDYYKGNATIPLATTEGALVASVNRGCKAITLSGGAKVRIFKSGQTRAPLMEAESHEAACRLLSYLHGHYKAIRKIAESDSSHLRLQKIDAHLYDGLIWLKITADTDNAMGMNMISRAAEKICLHLEGKVQGVKYLAVSGNMCVDKKPSRMTLEEGRGKSVYAEATIKGSVVRQVLKTTPQAMEKLNTYKNIIASQLTGSYGMNAHFANVTAAIYLATGQDMAHVVEGSHGVTIMKAKGNSLHASVTLPAVQVGTIGGGTKLPAQRECIRLMGIKEREQNASRKLANIVAAAVLAGELSLMAAHATKDLVKAHMRLNR
ncbi:hydroxymethylglutaryl-CoA reductase [Candidatus Woesearchaeota archaeon]|nr:hydroxymethylglutaryl-CoA reductase [Candidatus Woesearchaeota archaeon]